MGYKAKAVHTKRYSIERGEDVLRLETDIRACRKYVEDKNIKDAQIYYNGDYGDRRQVGVID